MVDISKKFKLDNYDFFLILIVIILLFVIVSSTFVSEESNVITENIVKEITETPTGITGMIVKTSVRVVP
ncbi:MAG: hypothetical protein ACE5J4_00855 [Candidatus Aenigmatarchaeota archaeon]